MSNVGFKVLASSGDQAIYTAGQPIWSTPAVEHPNAEILPLVKAGQFAFFDPLTGVSVNAGALASMNEVGICVGVGPRIGGPSKSLRMVIYDSLQINSIEYATVQPPRCATNPRGRLLINCISCDQPVGLTIRYRNSDTENSKDVNSWNRIDLTAKSVCNMCGDCTTADVSKAIACALEDSMKLKKPNYDIPSGDFPYINRDNPIVKITSIVAGQKGYNFCLNPVTAACGECIKLNAIIGIRWKNADTSGETPEDIDTFFTNTVDPADTTKSFVDQLGTIVDQINADILANNFAGRAYLGHGNQNTCCPNTLRIISCFDVVLLGGTQGSPTPINPCNTPANLLASQTIANACKDCGDNADTTKSFAGGLEIFFDLTDVTTGCLLDSGGRSFFGIEYNVEVTGIAPGEWMWIEDEELVLPENTGYQWMHIEAMQEVGGVGREEDYYNLSRGWYGEVVGSSRIKNLMAQGTESYCSFTLGGGTVRQTFVSNGSFFRGKWEQHFLIPSKDDTTIAGFQAYHAAMLSRDTVIVKGALNCKVDDDLLEGDFEDAVVGQPRTS